MKRKELTSDQFSKDLSVPLPTLKRWLRGKGVSLEAWAKMLNALGLTLSDVAATLSNPTTQQFEYTVRQEKELVAIPGLIAFFQELLNGKDPASIAQAHKLSQKSLTYYLKKLDAIGLVVWGNGLSVRIKNDGEPRWRKGGELSKSFRSKVFRELVEANREQIKIGLYELSERDEIRLQQMAGEIYLFAQQAEKKSRLTKHPTKPFGISWLFAHYSPDFLSVIPNKV